MNSAIISSTLLLTVLLAVGLVFFIRAASKDRTQQTQLYSEQTQEQLLPHLEQYFTQRGYQIAAVDPAQSQVTFAGFVRPSRFLAIFLTILAIAGTLCLALVFTMLVPKLAQLFLGLVFLAPLAGIFYWQKAGRIEQVLLQVQPLSTLASIEPTGKPQPQSLITVTAHRDELAALPENLGLRVP